ncbi:MAG: hypothetical protein AB8B91_05705 [Rubripirellula sp.]
MIASNCPRCQESFRLPSAELPDDAYAQCPWCRETFPLSEVIGTLPPILEVMSADGQPLQIGAAVAAASLGAVAMGAASMGADMETVAGEPIVEIEPDSDADLQEVDFAPSGSAMETVVEDEPSGFVSDLIDEADTDSEAIQTVSETAGDETVKIDPDDLAELRESADELGSQIDFEVETTDTNWNDEPSPAESESLAPMRVSPAPVRKKKSSSVRTIIGIALGAAASIPIAAGLLWVVGQFGYGPFSKADTAPAVTASVPGQLGPNSSPQVQRPTGRSLTAPEDESLTATNERSLTALEQIAQGNVETSADESDPSLEATEDASEPALILPGDDAAAETEGIENTLRQDTLAELPSDPPSIELPGTPTSDDTSETDLAMPTESSSETTTANEPEVVTVDEEPEIPLALPTAESVVMPKDPPEAAQLPSQPDELVATANRASKMVEALSQFEGSEKERLRRMLLTYTQIAEACALADGASESISSLSSAIRNSSVIDDVAMMSSEWLNFKDRKTSGIAAVGRPGANSKGQIITLDSGKVIQITGDVRLPAAERILVLGKIESGLNVKMLSADILP